MVKDCAPILSSKGIVFDLDGTLIDSVDSHVASWIISFEKVLNQSIKAQEIRELIGLSGRDIVKHFFGEEGVRKYRAIRWIKDRAFLKEIRKGNVGLFPGALKLLNELRHRGKLIGIATSTPVYMAIHILEYFKIFEYINEVVCGDEVSKGKPDPEIFIKSVRKLRILPHETTIIGDTIYDILPAFSIKAKAVLVNNNYSKPSRVYTRGNFQAFSNICSLLNCINGIQ